VTLFADFYFRMRLCIIGVFCCVLFFVVCLFFFFFFFFFFVFLFGVEWDSRPARHLVAKCSPLFVDYIACSFNRCYFGRCVFVYLIFWVFFIFLSFCWFFF